MRWNALGVVLAALVLTGCSTTSPTGRALSKRHPAESSSTADTSTTTSQPAPPPATVPTIGSRVFSVSGVTLSSHNWLTVGLHPTTAPVQLHVIAAAQLEVCPAGLDGSLTNTSWPSFFKFPSCLPIAASGDATLPPTDGATHVAFAIKAAPTAGPTVLSLTVSYAPTDTFVEVIPPNATSTNLSMTYTPQSSSTSVTVSPAGLVTPAPGYTIDVSQAGRHVSQAEPCDFPTEAEDCVGPVNPGQPLDVHIAGPGSSVVIYPSWK